MKAKIICTLLFCVGIHAHLLADIVVWTQQSAKDWASADAVWETSGSISEPPTSSDWAYMMSSNEVSITSEVAVNRLYLDRSLSGYTTTAATLSVLQGGTLTIGGTNGFADLGRNVSSGTLNVAGGSVIFEGTKRTGTYSLRVQDDYAAIINVTAGLLSIQNGSAFQIDAGGQSAIKVSGTGVIDFVANSFFNIGSGANAVNISDSGVIRYSGRNASEEIQTLAEAGKLAGMSPVGSAFTPIGSANGVGWFYDGTDTYAFAVPEPMSLIFLGAGILGLFKRR